MTIGEAVPLGYGNKPILSRGLCLKCMSRVCEHFPAIPLRKLSPRKLQVIRLVANGLRNKEIAEILNLSAETVKQYLHTSMFLLGLTNRYEVAQWVNKHPEVFGA